ncbi:MAG TPA: protein PilO [Desulfobacterales bacterium]|nr:protein PilO [Desulfobacterales bacterium]
MRTPGIFTNLIDPFLEKIGALSKVIRALISVGLLLVLVGSFTYFSYFPKFKEIEKLTKTHKKLVTQLTTAKNKAAKIDIYRSMMRDAEAEFKTALKALPDKREIPSLLTSVSRVGIDSGLEFLLFQPQPEVMKEFYAEIPVSIQVSGGYHNVALFFDRVARLPRIVNIKNIRMNQSKGSLKLTTTCTAVTYRYVETPKKKPVKKGKKRKKK